METKWRAPVSALTDHLGYWLRLVSNRVSAEFAKSLQARDTSAAEWVVLHHVYSNHPVTPGELASVLGLTRGAISKIIDKLEVKGWITGATSPEDQRVRLFSPTKQGRRVLPELAAIADRNDSHFFDPLTAAERAQLTRILAKLAQHHQIGAVPVE